MGWSHWEDLLLVFTALGVFCRGFHNRLLQDRHVDIRTSCSMCKAHQYHISILWDCQRRTEVQGSGVLGLRARVSSAAGLDVLGLRVRVSAAWVLGFRVWVSAVSGFESGLFRISCFCFVRCVLCLVIRDSKFVFVFRVSYLVSRIPDFGIRLVSFVFRVS